MNPTSARDVSLYELALSSQQPPQPLQVNLATIKSMVVATLDLLVEQQIAATLLVKLPPGIAWQDDLDRYHQLDIHHAIYVCNLASASIENLPQGSDSSAFPASEPYSIRRTAASSIPKTSYRQGNTINQFTELYNDSGAEAIGSEGLESTHPKTVSPIFELQLAQDESGLRREYFLFVLSAQFCAMILVHRPRSVRQSAEEIADSGDRSGRMLALCSFDRQTIQRVLEGLRVTMQGSQSKTIPSFKENAQRNPSYNKGSIPVAVEELLENWDSFFTSLFASDSVEREDLAYYAGMLWAKQVQQQEEVWRSAANYRKQATDADALHLEKEELQEALHLKDEFLSNVGQALRTPLTNMKTALTLLSSPHLKAAQRDRYLHLLNGECDRQTSLINGMLDLVRLDSVGDRATLQSLSLAEIVPGVVSTYQPLAQEKGVMLAYTVPDDLLPISCLRPWLKQIVINLLDNAIKFTPTGGQVWVRAKQQGDYIQLEFRDTGIGIPTNEIPKIFERFYRVRQAVDDHPGGAGLGLTIVQQLLLRCGGSISVNSKLGDGSNFKVLLPIYHTALAES